MNKSNKSITWRMKMYVEDIFFFKISKSYFIFIHRDESKQKDQFCIKFLRPRTLQKCLRICPRTKNKLPQTFL